MIATTMVGYNFVRAMLNFSRSSNAPNNSEEEREYKITGIRALFDVVLSLAFLFIMVTATLGGLASPTGNVALSALDYVAFAVGGGVFSLQLLPDSWFAKLFGISEVVIEDKISQTTEQATNDDNLIFVQNTQDIQHTTHFGLMFKQAYRSSAVEQIISQSNDLQQARHYLLQQIQQKLATWPEGAVEEKIAQKRVVLKAVNDMLENNNINEGLIDRMLALTPLVDQSFYRDKSDTRDILDAVNLYAQHQVTLSPSVSL